MLSESPRHGILVAALLVAAATTTGASQKTEEAPMLRGDTPATGQGWTADPVFTVGEPVKGYRPPGILDGTGAFRFRGRGLVRVLVNHELDASRGYAYELANGTPLTGARVSSFDIQTQTRRIVRAGLAYDTVYDRWGEVVTHASQINETGHPTAGLSRLCSATAVAAGTFGFEDDIFFTGEEDGGGRGGTEWALDVAGGALWAVPAIGRAAWENVTPVWTGDPETVALIGGDDSSGAPLYLYVGEKHARGDGSFLDRNGLATGRLYVWKSDAGDRNPNGFNGAGAVRTGRFVEVTARDPAMANRPGYDGQGYADIGTLQAEAFGSGAFWFSRPEDVATNPADPRQEVLASTGLGSLYRVDTWGTLYVIDVDVAGLSATIRIVHDADGLPVPDRGVRSPDNLTWAEDGFIYVQEDRSTSRFGSVTGIEASLWRVDPVGGEFVRIAEIDRSAVAPPDATDSAAGSLGNWESSGVLDVSRLFGAGPGETLLLGTVQAHGIRDGSIGGSGDLVQGGQLLFLSDRPGPPRRPRERLDRGQRLLQPLPSPPPPGGTGEPDPLQRLRRADR